MDGIYRRMVDDTANDANWDELDRYAAIVDQQIDLLVNYTAGDAFLYRQRARAAVAADTKLNLAGTGLAVLLSGLVAWLLARQIIGPVAAASAVAGRIANVSWMARFRREVRMNWERCSQLCA